MKGHRIGGQNCGPFLGTLHIRGRVTMKAQERTPILITYHIYNKFSGCWDYGISPGKDPKP